MVLESVLSAERAHKNPWAIALLAIVFVSLGIAATWVLGLERADFVLVLFVALPSIPFLLRLFDYEEEDVERGGRVFGSRTLARHMSALSILMFYFLGLIIAFTFWYMALPPDLSSNMFSLQEKELSAIKASFQGYATELVEEPTAFEIIFLHNLEVLALVVAFSILYGAGAVFILVWNASVISVFLASFARLYVLHAPEGLAAGLGYGLLGILPHGIFELLSYTTGALAGGILSSAVIRGAYKKPEFSQVIYDCAKLVSWAVLFLAIGAVIEGGVAL